VSIEGISFDENPVSHNVRQFASLLLVGLDHELLEDRSFSCRAVTSDFGAVAKQLKAPVHACTGTVSIEGISFDENPVSQRKAVRIAVARGT
jgi:hypothetical protein